MPEIKEYVDIRDHSTLRVGGQFRYFTEVTSLSMLKEVYAWAKAKSVKALMLGGGSNMVFHDGVIEVLAIKMSIFGFDIINDSHEHVEIRIGAGENWDYVVERAVGLGLSGIEALSFIPGTTGATPVQNVGAYGQEIKDTLLLVEVLNTETLETKIITNAECKFGYRDSIFKHDIDDDGVKGKYFIVSITLKLSKLAPTLPNYPGVKKYFEDQGIDLSLYQPTLKEIREAIIEIRKKKLPDPKEIPSVGSFFKNPIVENEFVNRIKSDYPNVVTFSIDDDYSKIPAGWLIEQTGLKGHNFGKVSVYPHNALVLVNNGEATYADILEACDQIQEQVALKFGINLETEPEFIY